MTRVLMIVAALVVAALAFLLEQAWLYAAAGVPLVVALAVFVRDLRRERRARSRRASRPPRPDRAREDMRSLGIVEVRPQASILARPAGEPGRSISRRDTSGREAATRRSPEGGSSEARDAFTPAAREPAARRPPPEAARPLATSDVLASEVLVEEHHPADDDGPGGDTTAEAPDATRVSLRIAAPTSPDAPPAEAREAETPPAETDEERSAEAVEDEASKAPAAEAPAAEAPAAEAPAAPAEADEKAPTGDLVPADEVPADAFAAPSAAVPAEAPVPAEAELDEAAPAEAEIDDGLLHAWGDSGVTSGSTVLGPLLQALRAATRAHTVCLLVQDDVGWEYRIAAISSRHRAVRPDGMFATRAPLLTASAARQPVSVVHLRSPEERTDLGYYAAADDPNATLPTVTHFALAPVPRPNAPETYFLLADAINDAPDLSAARARTLVKRFAELTGTLLAYEPALVATDYDYDALVETTETDTGTPGYDFDPNDVDFEAEIEWSEGASALMADDLDDEGWPEDEASAPRPRREIIAEEMERAYFEGRPMALVLVHLNRAEALAREGMVDEAERHLFARLTATAPHRRVERFGELTYGVFFQGDVDEVETWTLELHDDLRRARGILEGGASVGAAMFVARRHDYPDDLRDDATDALREAYETGTPVLIA